MDIITIANGLGILARAGKGSWKQTCPKCSPTRKHKHDKCLSVKNEGTQILYNCHHCDFKGVISEKGSTHATNGIFEGEEDRPSASYWSDGNTRRTSKREKRGSAAVRTKWRGS